MAEGLWWLVLFYGVAHMSAHAGDIQSHKSIRQTAESYVYTQLNHSDGKLTVTAGQLDRRLKLNACSQPLEAFFSSNRQNSARKTVGIRCTGGSGWTIYLPVTTSLMREVVVATRELPRKTLLTSNDLVMEQRDVAQLSNGYFEETRPALGKRLRRTLHVGDVITPSQLTASKTIKRGNRVIILAKAGSIEVRMSGKALSDGATGDRIKVVNDNNRKLEATVVKAGLVRVTL
ncbi:MAG: flagellar basal body P-ring formation chaperone FlgA [Candidatus Sedimenticola sp. (ex Thyasira tokunagai)]